jgi:hypothetical protein
VVGMKNAAMGVMWKWLNNNGQALEFLAAAVSALLTVYLLIAAWKHFKHVRTSSYIERYNAADFVEIRAVVDQFLYLTEKMKPDERGDLYMHLLLSDHIEDVRFRHKIWTFAMLFNEIGAAWEQKAIDLCLIKNFDRLIPRYWIRLRPYMMNLHLRFGFELPADLSGFEGKFKLFNSFRVAYLRMQTDSNALGRTRRFLLWLAHLNSNGYIERSKIGIDPQDIPTSSLLSADNHLPLERAMNGCRPEKPFRMQHSVIMELQESGTWIAHQGLHAFASS